MKKIIMLALLLASSLNLFGASIRNATTLDAVIRLGAVPQPSNTFWYYVPAGRMLEWNSFLMLYNWYDVWLKNEETGDYDRIIGRTDIGNRLDPNIHLNVDHKIIDPLSGQWKAVYTADLGSWKGWDGYYGNGLQNRCLSNNSNENARPQKRLEDCPWDLRRTEG